MSNETRQKRFRVALSHDVRHKGNAVFDLSSLTADPGIEIGFVEPDDGILPAAALADYDALILLFPRFARESIPANHRLGLIAKVGVGYDNVDVPACTEAGIALVTAPDGVRRPVAVATMTLLLALSGRLFVKDRLARLGQRGFDQRLDNNGVGLVGRVLGSVGIGNIGAEIFRLARPFEMRFIAHDPYVDPALASELGVRLVDLDSVFRESDFVTLNCPLTPQTRHLVDARRLALMKSTAFLINCARGPVVDQRALTRVLQERRIAGAGLDVFDPEPPHPDDPLLKLDNVIVTPHALCWTDQMFEGIGATDVKAALDLSRGRVPAGIVNAAVLENPIWQRRLARYGAS
jgi:phosphoglycerate dehydrogenase-like enzyme